jgi:photosystem II stability/assembly factor-like uncharacterized protein
LLLLPRFAHANGRFPASSSITFDPHDSTRVFVRTTFGLLASRDGGGSWRWICERAIGFSGMEDPTYVVTPRGTLVAGTFSGIAVSRDGGCSFSFAGGPGTYVVSDLAMRRDGEIVGMTSAYRSREGGVDRYDNRVLVSRDDAVTFTALQGKIDATLLLETIEVAPSDSARLYLTGIRGEGATRTAALLVSYDAGQTWIERVFALLQGETAPYLAAVDPKQADRLYVRTGGGVDTPSRLLLSNDAGKTWKLVQRTESPLLGFALSEDGAKVFWGSREGIGESDTQSFAQTRGAKIEAGCLGLRGETLWACASERTGFFVGASRTSGRSFEPKLRLDQLLGPLECPAESSVARFCASEWPKLRRELGLPDAAVEKREPLPSGPQLRGAPVRAGRSRAGMAGIFVAALVALIAYTIVRRFTHR